MMKQALVEVTASVILVIVAVIGVLAVQVSGGPADPASAPMPSLAETGESRPASLTTDAR